MIRRPAVLVPLSAAVVALAAGCSSSSGGAATSAPASAGSTAASTSPSAAVTTGTASSTAAAPSSPGASGTVSPRLRSVVLRASDLPSGYQSQAAQTDTDDSSDVQLAACTGVSGVKASDQTGALSSPNFSSKATEVSSDASTFTSQAAVNRRVAILRSSKIDKCLQTSLSQALGSSSGTKLVSSDIHLTTGSGGGPSNIVATVGGSLTLSANGQTGKLYVAVAFITGSRLNATAEIFQVGGPVAASLKSRVFAAVANRARTA